MHLAPRALQICGRLSEVILPTTSILPGCGFSIPFTRLLLRGDVQQVVDNNTDVQHSVYVDDIGQHGAGSSQSLYRTLRAAALELAQMAKRFKLRISDKSTIVTSSRAVSAAIQRALRIAGFTCQVQAVTRDLGLPFHAGGHRQGGLLESRRRRAGYARCKG